MEWLSDKFNDVLADLKRIHTSLTIWVNGIALTVIQALPYAQEAFPQLEEYISPNLYKNAMGILIVANIILRFKTTTALKDK